jgi:hypothetical protein
MMLKLKIHLKINLKKNKIIESKINFYEDEPKKI